MWEIWIIPLTSKWGKFKPENNIFLVKNAYCCVSQDFWKKGFRQANRKKLILPLEKYFKTLKDMIIGTAST